MGRSVDVGETSRKVDPLMIRWHDVWVFEVEMK